jgi:hypothetical protein
MVDTGKDKTSSWVNSQITDPPEVPPIVPTVIDMPGMPGAPNEASLSSDEEAKREIRRQSRRRSKYGGAKYAEAGEKRARRREARRADREPIKSSEGSGDGDRDHRGRYGGRTYDRYAPAPTFTPAKRGSWFKKITSL